MWLQVYQLQTELQNAQAENEFQRQRSLKSVCPESPQLQDEVRSLRCQLVKAEKLDPVRAFVLFLFIIKTIFHSYSLEGEILFAVPVASGSSGHLGPRPGGGHRQSGGASRAAPIIQGGERTVAQRQKKGVFGFFFPSVVTVTGPGNVIQI